MNSTPSERHLAENEVMFRQLNEQVQERYQETNRLALEDKQPEFITEHKSTDMPMHFYCECSDEKCTKRIKINLYDYEAIHRQRDHFIVVPGHEVAAIEKVVSKQPEYNVVEKLIAPPESADTLHSTY